jgi:hypothetical protein
MSHRSQIDTRITTNFLSRSFATSETIVIVLRCTSPATIAQRVVTLERVLQPRYLDGIEPDNRLERTCI